MGVKHIWDHGIHVMWVENPIHIAYLCRVADGDFTYVLGLATLSGFTIHFPALAYVLKHNYTNKACSMFLKNFIVE